MRQETHDTLCIILEDPVTRDIEELADVILVALEQLGQDILEHLDPPLGLRRWLESHGLSLVATSEVAAPRVWQTIEDDEEEEYIAPVETSSPLPQVGDRIRYHTVPRGPRAESSMGGGAVTSIHQTPEGRIVISVRPDGQASIIHLLPDEGDHFQIVSDP